MKESDRTGLQDSGTTASEDTETSNKDNRISTENDANAGKRTDPRPAYIELADDTDGASHVYRTTDETIHVVQDGKRVQRFSLGTRTVDDYVKFVRDDVEGRGWKNRRYIAADEDPFAALIADIPTEVAA
jgi:hypothetical protein